MNICIGEGGGEHDLNGECQWSTYSKERKKCLLHSIIESRKKQTTVVEYKLFALKKYVPWNNSPDLPVAMNIVKFQ